MNENPSTLKVELAYYVEFIKLARQLRDAQKEGKSSQRAQRRALSLEALFDAKLATIEKEIERLQQVNKQQLPLFGAEGK
jgi:hypothetical protein